MELEKTGSNINFIPCLTWVRRGVAKPNPERVKLTTEELTAVIQETKNNLKDVKEEEDSSGEGEEDEDGEGKENICTDNITVKEEPVKDEKVEKEEEMKEKTEEDITAEYGLEDYDEEEEGGEAPLLGLGDLTTFANPKDDPYLSTMDRELGEEDEEDREDFQIRGTDNLIVAGHVEGDSSTLEVWVYNDVEDALYIHHDILLSAFPLAVEWLAFDPESDTRGSLVAVGSMEPVIEVWDLDLVDSLEPAFKLGRKAKKKKKIPGVGHKDAVLSLSWNTNCEHVLASGSVDTTVLLWDLNTQGVAGSLPGHQEKVQSLHFHHTEAHHLLTGDCHNMVRLYDCRAPENHTSWKVAGEVERVLWDHFNPNHCLASTEAGTVHYIDIRKPSPLWTLSAHSEAVTGISLSSQCPGTLTTVSQDKAMKVWDISGPQPTFVSEREVKLGALHTVQACPDAPFVVCMGGDKPSDNFKVYDLRDSQPVRTRFGSRKLVNPLNTADFGFSTADEAEPVEEMETMDAAAANLESMSLAQESEAKPKPSGGAVSKFKKKDKDKRKKKHTF